MKLVSRYDGIFSNFSNSELKILLINIFSAFYKNLVHPVNIFFLLKVIWPNYALNISTMLDDCFIFLTIFNTGCLKKFLDHKNCRTLLTFISFKNEQKELKMNCT